MIQAFGQTNKVSHNLYKVKGNKFAPWFWLFQYLCSRTFQRWGNGCHYRLYLCGCFCGSGRPNGYFVLRILVVPRIRLIAFNKILQTALLFAVKNNSLSRFFRLRIGLAFVKPMKRYVRCWRRAKAWMTAFDLLSLLCYNSAWT
jgi:hypothetical protein